MKAYIISIAVIFLIIFCNGQVQSEKDGQAAEELAHKNECFKCHADTDNKKPIGPTFRQIATKYKSDSLVMKTLVERVKKGSKGYWTEISRGVPMPPYSGTLSDIEITALVQWVLNQKN